MQIEITSEERDLLVEILRADLLDLRSEIQRTDTSAFKKELRTRAELLDRILNKLRHLKPAEATVVPSN